MTARSVPLSEHDPSAFAYSTSKGSIVTISKSLGGYAIEQGIRVNVVCPGPIWFIANEVFVIAGGMPMPS